MSTNLHTLKVFLIFFCLKCKQMNYLSIYRGMINLTLIITKIIGRFWKLSETCDCGKHVTPRYNFVMRWSIFTFSGWVNTLLSWKGIIPLSRLTYTAYLVHPVVMETYYLSRRNLIEFSDIEAVSLTYTRNLLEAPVC